MGYLVHVRKGVAVEIKEIDMVVERYKADEEADGKCIEMSK